LLVVDAADALGEVRALGSQSHGFVVQRRELAVQRRLEAFVAAAQEGAGPPRAQGRGLQIAAQLVDLGLRGERGLAQAGELRVEAGAQRLARAVEPDEALV